MRLYLLDDLILRPIDQIVHPPDLERPAPPGRHRDPGRRHRPRRRRRRAVRRAGRPVLVLPLDPRAPLAPPCDASSTWVSSDTDRMVQGSAGHHWKSTTFWGGWRVLGERGETGAWLSRAKGSWRRPVGVALSKQKYSDRECRNDSHPLPVSHVLEQQLRGGADPLPLPPPLPVPLLAGASDLAAAGLDSVPDLAGVVKLSALGDGGERGDGGWGKGVRRDKGWNSKTSNVNTDTSCDGCTVARLTVCCCGSGPRSAPGGRHHRWPEHAGGGTGERAGRGMACGVSASVKVALLPPCNRRPLFTQPHRPKPTTPRRPPCPRGATRSS